MEKLLYEGALEKIGIILNERIKRLIAVANKMQKSIELYKSVMGNKASDDLIKQKTELMENIQNIQNSFEECREYSGNEQIKENFLKNLDQTIEKMGKDYIKVIQNLNEQALKDGISWLLNIVENARNAILKLLPSFN